MQERKRAAITDITVITVIITALIGRTLPLFCPVCFCPCWQARLSTLPLKNIPNKKVCLDIGHIRFFEHFSKQYLTKFFKNANLVQLNHNVISLLFERLQVEDEFEFFHLLDLDLLVITNGKKGATFIYRKDDGFVKVDKSPEVIAQLVDSSGAGDAFFATIVKNYAYQNEINDDFIANTFAQANKASREVISQLGSRRN